MLPRGSIFRKSQKCPKQRHEATRSPTRGEVPKGVNKPKFTPAMPPRYQYTMQRYTQKRDSTEEKKKAANEPMPRPQGFLTAF
ncbi:unnamed protein product [Caenorhabditis auriculariae]|uniref:Uncharacterized protein n=1 Tax=Caenorhabditis auriculariae TaxID=2777116 RepID=A0A8S1GR54_9PELO|nr:unnamed protein product [Caenorhabditis auriculariae]